eukprot:4081303-Lingulodinium_polyedra.AAC.1
MFRKTACFGLAIRVFAARAMRVCGVRYTRPLRRGQTDLSQSPRFCAVLEALEGPARWQPQPLAEA